MLQRVGSRARALADVAEGTVLTGNEMKEDFVDAPDICLLIKGFRARIRFFWLHLPWILPRRIKLKAHLSGVLDSSEWPLNLVISDGKVGKNNVRILILQRNCSAVGAAAERSWKRSEPSQKSRYKR